LAQDRLRLEERAKIAGQPQVAHAYVDNANRKAETAKHHGVVRPPPMPRLRHCFPQRSGPSHHPSNGDGGRYQRAIKLEYGGCLLKTCESMQDHGLRELCAFEINHAKGPRKSKDATIRERCHILISAGTTKTCGSTVPITEQIGL
jgi:hypothetical protein